MYSGIGCGFSRLTTDKLQGTDSGFSIDITT
jgi:hypothetical protein